MIFFKFIIAFSLMLSINACQQKRDVNINANSEKPPGNVQRIAMVTGLKPEKLAYYKQLHADAWPAVQKKITECNIKNYSIYLKEINGQLLLFSYFEYAGVNFDEDMKRMAADTTTQRWWKETDPCQQPLPDAAAKKQIWSNMQELFHQD